MQPGEMDSKLDKGDGAQWNAPAERAVGEPLLKVDVDGFEGPLDLLLELARRQKVDLSKISILALAEQYLAFIESIRSLRIEIAADYLVMAAWLAYLKSRLLLPDEEEEADELSAEEMAAHLAFRLQRLDAMRQAANRLVNRNRLGRDFFARGNPEPVELERRSEYSASLYDLLTAYAAQRQRTMVTRVTIARRQTMSLTDARQLLVRFCGGLKEWTALDALLAQYLHEPAERVSALASSFAASLEMAREGAILLRQEAAYAPIYLRAGKAASAPETRSAAGQGS